tara:strand:+ start:465 stop:680 length:216 start_codon:yes stop_codon:yes gene_type:complete
MGTRKDLKKHGILTNYKGGDAAMDAAIEAIKKDPEMRHMWGLGDRFKVKKKKPVDSLKIAKKNKKSKTRTA